MTHSPATSIKTKKTDVSFVHTTIIYTFVPKE